MDRRRNRSCRSLHRDHSVHRKHRNSRKDQTALCKTDCTAVRRPSEYKCFVGRSHDCIHFRIPPRKVPDCSRDCTCCPRIAARKARCQSTQPHTLSGCYSWDRYMVAKDCKFLLRRNFCRDLVRSPCQRRGHSGFRHRTNHRRWQRTLLKWERLRTQKRRQT